MTYNTLHIFTDDCLRLLDNVSLLNSLAMTEKLYTVFYFGHIKKIKSPPPHRIIFLLDCLKNLKENLDRFGIPLYLIDAPMFPSLRDLIPKWNINRVTTESAVSLFGKKSQLSLRNYLSAFGVRLQTNSSNTLYDISKVPVNTSRSEFFRTVTQLEPELPLAEEITESLSQFSTNPGPDINRSIPILEDFGITADTLKNIDTRFTGGETAATAQLEKLISTRCDTNKLTKAGQVHQHDAISPAIKFGCISVRTVYKRVSRLGTEYDEMTNQIYDGLRTRDYCLLIGGNCPNIDNQASIYTYLLPWDHKLEVTARFHEGKTGYPFVDAAIAQLKQEGFLHNSVRSILVRALTCDLMWIGWHEGVKMFYKWSLDYNAAICALSWMHGSKSTWLLDEISISQINPIEEAKEIDRDGDYIRKYLPELKDFPNEYIHIPWIAPMEVQTDSNCVIGEDYPNPLYSDVETRFQLCRKRLQVFYNLLRIVKGRGSLTALRKRERVNNNNNSSSSSSSITINVNTPFDSKAAKLTLTQ